MRTVAVSECQRAGLLISPTSSASSGDSGSAGVCRRRRRCRRGRDADQGRRHADLHRVRREERRALRGDVTGDGEGQPQPARRRGPGDETPGDDDAIDADLEAIPATLNGGAGADFLAGGGAGDAINGDAGPDVVLAHRGDDTIDGGDGDDTLRARDGFADVVNCGPGADIAEVDTLDRVEDCEDVRRAEVGNANDVPRTAHRP